MPKPTTTVEPAKSETAKPPFVVSGEAQFYYRDYADKSANPDATLTRLSADRFLAPFNINNMHADQKRFLESRNRLHDAMKNPSNLGHAR